MRTLYLLTTIYIATMLSSCATFFPTNDKPKTTTAQVILPANKPVKDPAAVALIKGPLPTLHYKVIGKGSISKYNVGGIKRQEAIIHDALRGLAASMGGDAIIDIKHDEKNVTGTVITFDDREHWA